MKMKPVHVPVLLKEAIEGLRVERNKNYIDATIGEGGHAKEILKRNGPKGKVLGIEINPVLYKKLKGEKIKRLILVQGSFSQLQAIVKKAKFKEVAGVLFDLGISSWHLERSGLGFSFQREEPLIMRYDLENIEEIKDGLTAAKVLNEFPEKKIEEILKNFGEERFANKIAKKIVEERKRRKITETFHLVEIIKECVPSWYQCRKIHFATKTFMALRIFVNQELERLREGLAQAVNVLQRGGRIMLISFHSLEERIIKKFFKEMEKKGILKIITKKPIFPSKEEILKNPRSRSAKLRIAQKL